MLITTVKFDKIILCNKFQKKCILFYEPTLFIFKHETSFETATMSENDKSFHQMFLSIRYLLHMSFYH